jgi:hypothetical protein
LVSDRETTAANCQRLYSHSHSKNVHFTRMAAAARQSVRRSFS